MLAGGCLNIIFNWPEIATREGIPTTSDIYLGIMMVLLVIEAGRRAMGWPLPIVAIVAIIYALFGPYFPGMLAHGGFPISELAPFEYLRTDGIFGVPLGVSASFIFLFVLFGAILSVSGAGHPLDSSKPLDARPKKRLAQGSSSHSAPTIDRRSAH